MADILVTSSAFEAIASQIKSRGRGLGVRIGVKASGCSGMSYVFEFCDQKNPEDLVITQGNVSVVVDPVSLVYLNGTEIDYESSRFKSGFKLNNPNVKDSCGCGESFTV